MTSEAVAFRRIISERQNSYDGGEHMVKSRWSTPPKFGLSPPGNSKLAKRRSLKNKRNSLTIGVINDEKTRQDSPGNTPVQSPDISLLIEKDLKRRLQINSASGPDKNGLGKLTPDHLHSFLIHPSSNDNDDTMLSTARAEYNLDSKLM